MLNQRKNILNGFDSRLVHLKSAMQGAFLFFVSYFVSYSHIKFTAG
nr:MAG TPA: hypothetical protein [Caudoviricetes sp.]